MNKGKKNNPDDLENTNNLRDMKETENEMKPTGNAEKEALDPVNEKTVAENKEAAQTENSPDKKNVEAELEKKNKEIETLTETMKRRQADFENYKKRMVKIQDEQKKYALKDFALEIIHVNDDLLRAYEAACNIDRQKAVDEICNTFSEGYVMLSKKIEELLQRYGIKEIDSLNKGFDPTSNEAIEIDESENVDNETVTKVHQKGFRFDDLVVRAAKVRVTKPKKNSKNSGNEINKEQAQNNNNSESKEA